MNQQEQKFENEEESAMNDIFDKLCNNGDGYITTQQILNILSNNGISKEDPRIKESIDGYLKENRGIHKKLDKEEFLNLLKKPDSEIIKKALMEHLVIPDFKAFKEDIETIYHQTKSITKGKMDEILPHPQPERQPAYAVSICTIDGQLLQLGDHDLSFLLQSISKPINYAIAVKEAGKEKVHEHVGSEPGDESFDSGHILNEKDLPHNPMLTSGAIMTSSLIKPDLKVEERLKHVIEVWENMTGDKEVKYNEESFKAEIKNSDKQFALAHLMKQRQAFPEDVDLENVIKFYLKCNALELNIDDLAHAAATLANYGKCPSTGKKVFDHDTVRDTLSLMLTSGMYGHSGQFAFRVGIPAKSGIGGGIMAVIPELMGIAVYYPPLDSHGNSARGVAFFEELADTFNFHKFDAKYDTIHNKKDPRKKKNQGGNLNIDQIK